MITHKELTKAIRYNQTTGIFYRKWPRLGLKETGFKRKTGYVVISFKKDKYYAHRLAWFYVYGAWPENQIDHINHNRSDNRIENLRSVKQVDNSRNLSTSSKNTSGFTGVNWNIRSGRWESSIKVNYKRINLGMFEDKECAIKARKAANIKYGFHKNHGR